MTEALLNWNVRVHPVNVPNVAKSHMAEVHAGEHFENLETLKSSTYWEPHITSKRVKKGLMLKLKSHELIEYITKLN